MLQQQTGAAPQPVSAHKIFVLNAKTHDVGSVYNRKDVKVIDIMFTHGSILGNRGYKQGESSLETYKKWLRNEYRKVGDVYYTMWNIVYWLKQGLTVYLVCNCVPKPCHGDVIKYWVEWIINTNQQKITTKTGSQFARNNPTNKPAGLQPPPR